MKQVKRHEPYLLTQLRRIRQAKAALLQAAAEVKEAKTEDDEGIAICDVENAAREILDARRRIEGWRARGPEGGK